MSRRRRTTSPMVRTISCPDTDWERVRKKAAAADMSMSQYVVSRALTTELVVDAGDRPRFPPRLVLGEEEQVRIRDQVAMIAERMADPDDLTDLGKLRKRVAFILTATMNDMVDNRRTREMTLILADLFGPEEGERIAEKFLSRRRSKGQFD